MITITCFAYSFIHNDERLTSTSLMIAKDGEIMSSMEVGDYLREGDSLWRRDLMVSMAASQLANVFKALGHNVSVDVSPIDAIKKAMKE